MRQKAKLTVAALISSPAYAGGGMPQLDPTWFANGFFWLFVSFVVFYLLIARRVVPTIASVLKSREEAITGAIREAERAKHEAESTRGSATSEGNSARAKAAEIIAKAQAEASSDASDALAKLDRDLAARVNHAAAVLEDAVSKAKAGVDAAAADLAQAMVEKLSGAADEDATPARKLKLAKS